LDLQTIVISVVGSTVAVMLGFMLFIVQTVVKEWRKGHGVNTTAIVELRGMVQRLLDGQDRHEDAQARVETLLAKHGGMIEAIHDSLTKLDRRVDNLRDGQQEIEAELRQAIGALEGRQEATEGRLAKVEEVVTRFLNGESAPHAGGQ